MVGGGWPPFGESRIYIYNRGCASQVSFGLNKFGPNQLTNPLTKLDFHVDFDVHLHVGHHVHLVYLYVGHHNVVSTLFEVSETLTEWKSVVLRTDLGMW